MSGTGQTPRRAVLGGVGSVLAAGLMGRHARSADLVPWMSKKLPEGTRAEAVLESLPGKKPLIKLSYRPPNYEAPIETFAEAITPNDRFFVRYHLAGIPDMGKLEKNWVLRVGGDAAERSFELSLDQLRKDFPTVEIGAVCQCSGNRRGLSQPHVPGVEWGYGAMGNAVWRGARLRDVLARAGVKAAAVEVWLDGADEPVLPQTPDFRKSLPMEKALADEVIIAYAMNGEKLPLLNGFPARVVVPGWTATYWMKHVTAIEVSSRPLDSFWMRKAYRVPKGMFPVAHPFASQVEATSEPITDMVVNSVIAAPVGGSSVPRTGATVEGVAWDRGNGIRSVEVSTDGGESWRAATLGADHGRFAFRSFGLETGPLPPGAVVISARAISNAGETQSPTLKFNPAGYHNNVPQVVTVTVA